MRESLRRWTLKWSQAIFDEKKVIYELVLSWFLLINLQPFLKITCGTNDRLKLTLQKKSDYQ